MGVFLFFMFVSDLLASAKLRCGIDISKSFRNFTPGPLTCGLPKNMALAGWQLVNLVATVDGEAGSDEFPPCGVINAATPFPPSPTPGYTLVTSQVMSVYPFSDATNYPKANAAVNMWYWKGATKQQARILVTQNQTTVNSGL